MNHERRARKLAGLVPVTVAILGAVSGAAQARADIVEPDAAEAGAPATTDAPEGDAEQPPGDAPGEGAPAQGTLAEAAPATPPPEGEDDAGGEPDEPEGPEPDQPRHATSAEAGQAMSGQVETDEEGEVTDVGKKKKEKNLSHWKLGMVSVAAGYGMYMIVPYTDDQFCGQYSSDFDDNDQHQSLCTNPNDGFYLDFAAGYGAVKRMDVVLNFRLNLLPREFRCEEGSDPATCKGQGLFNDSLGFGLGPGIRAWISKPHQLFKVAAAIDILWTREKFSGYRARTACTGPPQCAKPPEPADKAATDAERGISDNDVELRLGPVLQIDPHHNVGVIITPLARLSFVRWLEINFGINLGVQARFP